ncbi:hypothetical protein Sbal625DRAFT_3989 [Shewanella baltica OS625]|uniref:hypothetical protein n=1 Tax=Shewanella TaxID=22 RepID=UPI000230D88F|nr:MULTISPECIES: hypothetical protein [Shewanella]EHC04399.1 hypothetical protein Sbal625DRAFT_3989 [Shewanella baltica OS625]MBW3513191.1 hypothetical protein [Shewanella sp. NKUCC01_JLK]
MGLPVTVYRWDDAGAPQLSKGIKPSELINVLKKCLVDGYGSKQGAGWSVPFMDLASNQIVFRNSTLQGSGSFVKFWSRSAGDVLSGVFYFQSAPFLASLNPDWANTNGAGWRCFASGSPHPYKWILIATAAAFIFFTYGDSPFDRTQLSTAHFPSFFIGDIDSVVPNDATRFITMVSGSVADSSLTTSPSWTDGITYLSQSATVAKMHETDGSHNPKQMVVKMAWSTYNTTAIKTLPIDGLNMFFAPVQIEQQTYAPNQPASQYLDSAGNNCTNSMLHPAVRGTVPGLFQSSFTGFTDALLPITRNVNGTLFYLLPTGHVGASNLWIGTGEWYA